MRGVSGREWVILSSRISPPEDLVRKYGPFLAQLIANRGFEGEHERIFDLRLRNIPPYRLIPGIEEGTERIVRAVKRRERIILFGDYDVDGITATAILFQILKKAGARVVPVLPSRGTGYGLSERLLKIFSRYGDLLITVDNGSSAFSEFDSFPIDVIVIDHHNVPDGDTSKGILINPRSDGNTPRELKEISSSAMCFYIGTLIANRLGLDIDTRYHLDLVALGTVADVMPMNYLNRIFVSKGLKLLESVFEGALRKPGIRSLLEVSRIGPPISAKDISYSVAPRLNAPGRIGDPKVSLDLLLEEDPLRARILSRKIEVLNSRRRALTDSVLREASQMVNQQRKESFIAVWSDKWHVGVLGIVAGRLSNTTGKPVAVIAQGEEKSVGSVRSSEGINIYDGLKQISDLFLKWGGHPGAMGITLKSSDLERFRSSANEVFSHIPRDPPPLYADMELSPSELSSSLIEKMKILEPFGEGNPYPSFVSPPVEIENVEGSNGKVRIKVEGREVLCWERKLVNYLMDGRKVRILYQVMNDDLTLVDLCPT